MIITLLGLGKRSSAFFTWLVIREDLSEKTGQQEAHY